jgi:hypothetical protein
VKYTLVITDDTGHEHLKLGVEDSGEHEADQHFYSMMLMRALDVSVSLMPEDDKERWNAAFERVMEELS